MTVGLVIGCCLVVWGPLLALYALFVASSPKLVILSIGSSFFYCSAVVLTSVLWYIVVPARALFYWAIPVSVILQAISRYILYALWTQGQTSLALSAGAAVPQSSKSDQLASSFAAGLGAGLGCTLVLYLGVLWNFTGPGTLYSLSCSGIPLMVVSALMALAWALLHTLLGVLSWHAYRSKSKRGSAVLLLVHMVAAGVSSLNSAPSAMLCLAPLGITWLLVAALAAYTFARTKSDRVFVKRIK